MANYNDDANFTPQKETIKPLRPFRAWVQKVLPQVYDDSLSYSELLYRVLSVLNDMIENMGAFDQDIENLISAYNLLQDYVNNYFDTLDVDQALEDKLDELLTSGEYRQLFIDVVEGKTADWLAQHIVEGYAVDDTLAISGAAADSRTVGNRFKQVWDLNGTRATQLESGTDLNDILTVGNYIVTPADTAENIANIPEASAGRLLVVENTVSSRRIQIYMTNSTTVRVYLRYYNGTRWYPWTLSVGTDDLILKGANAESIPNGSDLNSYTSIGNYRVTSPDSSRTILNCPVDRGGRLTVMTNNQGSGMMQYYVPNTAGFPKIYYRYGSSGETGYTWTEWYTVKAMRASMGNLRILGVGNSYTRNAMRYLWRILHDAGYDVVVGQWYYPASTLKMQYNDLVGGTQKRDYLEYTGTTLTTYSNYTFPDALHARDWDIVIFQQASIYSSKYEYYVNNEFDINDLRDLIAGTMGKDQTQIRWGLMLPWSYAHGGSDSAGHFEEWYDSDPDKMLAAIKTATQQAADHIGNCMVINCGIGIDRGRHNSYLNAIGTEMCKTLTDNGTGPDLSHLENGIPQYLASLVYAGTITGMSCFDVDYFPALASGVVGTGYQAYLAKVAAQYAVDWLNVSYDESATLEERIADLESAVSQDEEELAGKVPFTGGEMTGQLRVLSWGDDVARVPVCGNGADGYRINRISSVKEKDGSDNIKVAINGQWGNEGGDFYFGNFIGTLADASLVENAEAATDGALDIVDAIPVKAYDWLSGLHIDYGILGDDLLTDLSYIVSGGTGTRSLNTVYLIALLIKAVQELKAEVDAL